MISAGRDIHLIKGDSNAGLYYVRSLRLITLMPAPTTAMVLLEQNMCPGAFHNSEERYESPKCLLKTRLAILAQILDYVRDPVQTLGVFLWLYWSVGVGKSAIAIAEMCDSEV